MGCKKLKPNYDSKIIMQELIDITKELFKSRKSYRQIARELDLSVSKVIKLLITGGVYLFGYLSED